MSDIEDNTNDTEERPAQATAAVVQPYMGRVAVRAPPFWKDNPALWFRQLESQFYMNGITVSETKYHIAVAALDTAVINQVSDIVMNPPAVGMYETLKLRLQERFAESEERRFKKLIGSIELGDKKPSYLWREMRDLAGTRLDEGFLRSLWLQRLPAQIQAILSTNEDDITRVLPIADRIHEVLDVRAVSSLSPPTDDVVLAKTHGIATNYQQLCIQVNELSQQMAAMSSNNQNNHRSRSFERGSRTRPRSRSSKQFYKCWYHYKFGKDARKCIKPFTYTTENPLLLASSNSGQAISRLILYDHLSRMDYLIDTGADVSVLPPSPPDLQNQSSAFGLVAANGTSIPTYGKRLVKVSLGLRREFPWVLTIANVTRPIIGADFLKNFNCSTDVSTLYRQRSAWARFCVYVFGRHFDCVIDTGSAYQRHRHGSCSFAAIWSCC